MWSPGFCGGISVGWQGNGKAMAGQGMAEMAWQQHDGSGFGTDAQ